MYLTPDLNTKMKKIRSRINEKEESTYFNSIIRLLESKAHKFLRNFKFRFENVTSGQVVKLTSKYLLFIPNSLQKLTFLAESNYFN